MVTHMKRRTKRVTIFILVNLAFAAAVIFIAVYKKFSAETGADPLGMCVMHDFLHLYCPGCGGTRAVMLLVRGDVIGAMLSNPIVPCYAALYIFLAVYAAVAILRDRDRIIYWNTALTWIIAMLPIAVFIVRNVLLVVWGVDTIGDLGVYWS